MADNPKVTIEISAPTGEAQEAFARVADGVKQLADQMARQMGKAKESFDITKMLNRFQPLAQALGDVKNKLDETVSASLSWTTEVNGLARMLGVTATEAGGLSKALGGLGISTDTYRGAALNLQRSLDVQEGAFNANGIATRKANGEMLGIQQVMMNTIARLREMKPGYDANALAMLAFGQSAKDLGGLMKLTNEAIGEGAAKVKALGMEVDSSGTAAAKAYQSAMNDACDALDALKIKVGQDLMPVLADVAKTFADIASSVAGPLAKALGAIIGLFEYWGVVLGAAAILLKGQLTAALTYITAVAIPAMMTKVREMMLTWALNTFAMTGGLTKIGLGFTALTKGIVAAGTAFMTSFGGIVILLSAIVVGLQYWTSSSRRASEEQRKQAEATLQTADALQRYSDKLRDADAELKDCKEGTETYNKAAERKAAILEQMNRIYPDFNQYLKDENGNERSVEEATRLANEALKKKIELEKEALKLHLATLAADAERHQDSNWFVKWWVGYKKTKEEIGEVTVALNKLDDKLLELSDTGGGGGKKFKKASTTSIAANKPASDDQDAHVQAWKAAEAEKEEARKAAAEKAAQEAEAAAKAAQEEANALALAQLEDERVLADHKVAMGQMTAEKRLEMERGFIAQEYEIRARGAEDAAQLDLELQNKLKDNTRKHHEEQTKKWRDLGDSIKRSMGDAFVGLINGTMSWGDATKKVLDTVLQGFIDMAAKELLSFITMENAKTAAKAVATGARTAMAWAGSAAESAASIAAALKGMLADAWAAAAAAFKAFVGLGPWGIAAGIGAAATATGLVLAMTGNLPSAAGGYYDVPRDQLAMIHKQEMVLPAAHSQRLRSLIEGAEEGGAGGGLGSGGGTVNVNISATDAAGVARLFRNNGSALVRALKGQARNFAFQG
jgi:hypothetical protein